MRSKFEETIYNQLKSAGINPRYEEENFIYTTTHNHIPDFPVIGRELIIEAKGRFTADDRRTIMSVKSQNPNIDYRIVFQNAYTKLNKNSSTTYAQWCDKYCIKWANKVIPDSWIQGIKNGKNHWFEF